MMVHIADSMAGWRAAQHGATRKRDMAFHHARAGSDPGAHGERSSFDAIAANGLESRVIVAELDARSILSRRKRRSVRAAQRIQMDLKRKGAGLFDGMLGHSRFLSVAGSSVKRACVCARQ